MKKNFFPKEKKYVAWNTNKLGGWSKYKETTNQKIKKPMIMSLYDIAKFFDREMLIDALDAVYNAEIKGKLYRLLFMLNKDTQIQVKTTV